MPTGTDVRAQEAGRNFLELEQRDPWDFRFRFAQAMLIAHPYLGSCIGCSVRESFFSRGSRGLNFPATPTRGDTPPRAAK